MSARRSSREASTASYGAGTIKKRPVQILLTVASRFTGPAISSMRGRNPTSSLGGPGGKAG